MNRPFFYLSCIMLSFNILLAQKEKSGGELIYGEEQYPRSYDPFSTGENMASLRVSQLLFETLVTENEYGDILPQLAESWKIINDKTVRFKVRDNIKWHDNEIFSGDDVKFTVEALKNNKSDVDSYFREMAQEIESVEINNNIVEITLTKPNTDILKFFTKLYIYPAHIFSNNKIDNTIFYDVNFIGTGPYKYKSMDPGGTKIRFSKNSDYYNDVYINNFICSVQPDPDLSLDALRSEGITMKVNVPSREVGKLEATGILRIVSYSSLKINAVAFNFSNALLKNKFLRKAIITGTNREYLLETYYQNYGQVLSGPFAPNSIAYNPNVMPIEFNQNKASLYLKNAGCVDSNNDGIYEYNNKKLEFNLLLPVESQKKTAIIIADAIKSQLANIGIKVNVERLERSTFLQRTLIDKDFDLALVSINFDKNVNIAPLFHKDGNKNFIDYNNKLVNELFEEADESADKEKKRTIFYKLHEILAEDCPYMFLWTLKNNAAYHKKVRNVTIDPFKFFQSVNNWYIDPNYR